MIAKILLLSSFFFAGAAGSGELKKTALKPAENADKKAAARQASQTPPKAETQQATKANSQQATKAGKKTNAQQATGKTPAKAETQQATKTVKKAGARQANQTPAKAGMQQAIKAGKKTGAQQATGQTPPKAETQQATKTGKKAETQQASQTGAKAASEQQMNKASDLSQERKIMSESLSPESGFLEFGLEYPLNFGIHLRYLLDDSLYGRLGLGFMPGFFLDSFEKLSPSFGYLKEEEAKIISNIFENSMYVEARLAWAPYLKESGGGPYLELGLSGALRGKGKLKGDSLSKALEDDSFDELKNYSAKTNTANATAHIGYQIPFEKIKLNLEIGLSKILWAEITAQSSITAANSLNEKQKEKFKSFLEKKGWIFPTVSGWISFAF